MVTWGDLEQARFSGNSGQRPEYAAANASLWPTARASDANGVGSHGDGGPDLRTAARHWPTSTLTGNHNRKGASPDSGDGLATAAAMWPTPRADEHSQENSRDRGMALSRRVKFWPTPTACNPNDGESPETWRARAAMLKQKHGNGNDAGTPLSIAAQEHWATPSARDWKSGCASEATLSRNSRPLNEQVISLYSLPDPEMMTAGDECSESDPISLPPSQKRKLNPFFVEWLMGFPWGSSEPGGNVASLDCDASGTPSYLSRLRWRLLDLLLG